MEQRSFFMLCVIKVPKRSSSGTPISVSPIAAIFNALEYLKPSGLIAGLWQFNAVFLQPVRERLIVRGTDEASCFALAAVCFFHRTFQIVSSDSRQEFL